MSIEAKAGMRVTPKTEEACGNLTDITFSKFYTLFEKNGCLYFRDDAEDIRSYGIWEHKLDLIPSFQAMKIRATGEADQAAVQEYLFSQGYKWFGDGTTDVKHISVGFRFYISDEDGTICYGCSRANFETHVEPEFIPTFTRTCTLEPLPEPIKETVELNGKVYLKEDLESALEKLTPVATEETTDE